MNRDRRRSTKPNDRLKPGRYSCQSAVGEASAYMRIAISAPVISMITISALVLNCNPGIRRLGGDILRDDQTAERGIITDIRTNAINT